MCLSIAQARPNAVLTTGKHLGFEWQVIHNGMGFRCGYVKIPLGHPWYKKDYNDIEVDVHGGLTFTESDVLCEKSGPDDGWWIGFDCAHADDKPDPMLPHERDLGGFFRDGVVRTQSYVENECRRVCEQAKNAVSNDKD